MSSTYQDGMVTVQHCEVVKEDGNVCDEYLGANYPVTWCHRHPTVFALHIEGPGREIFVQMIAETVKPLIDELTSFAQGDPFKVATIREIRSA